METREFLSGVPFFAMLDREQLQALAAQTRRAEFDHGSTIIHEADSGHSMFAIVSGTASVSTRIAGRQVHVATLHAGEIVGEMSLLTGARRSATVTAVGPVIALEISKAAIEPILAASPSLHERFATVLADRRADLDRLHGDGFWNLYGLPRDKIAAAMRDFFAK